MLKHAVAIAVTLIVFNSLPASARGNNGATSQYIEYFKETMKLLVAADNQMYTQMQVVARKVETFYRRHGHVPFDLQEQTEFKASVAKHLIANPYKPETKELYYKMDLQDDGKVKVFFLNDSSLNPWYVKEYRKTAPAGWQADPGTIMVMVNGEGTYAIWSTSADRLPLRDYQRNNRTRIISHDLAAEAEAERQRLAEQQQSQY